MPPKNLIKPDSNEALMEREFAKLDKLKYSKDAAQAKKCSAQIERILVFREKEGKSRAEYDKRLKEALALVMAETVRDPQARRRVVRREIVEEADGTPVEAPKAEEQHPPVL